MPRDQEIYNICDICVFEKLQTYKQQKPAMKSVSAFYLHQVQSEWRNSRKFLLHRSDLPYFRQSHPHEQRVLVKYLFVTLCQVTCRIT